MSPWTLQFCEFRTLKKHSLFSITVSNNLLCHLFYFLLAKIANVRSQCQYTSVDTLHQGELGTSWHLDGNGSYKVCQMASSSWALLSWEEVQKATAGKSGSCSLCDRAIRTLIAKSWPASKILISSSSVIHLTTTSIYTTLQIMNSESTLSAVLCILPLVSSPFSSLWRTSLSTRLYLGFSHYSWPLNNTGLNCAWVHLHEVCVCLVTQSCPTLRIPIGYSPPGSLVHGNSPGKNTGVGCHALLQGIFPTQGSNPCLLPCRWILLCLSHQESPRILECIAYPFFRGPSQPRNWTRVSFISGRFFTSWATREADLYADFTP